MTCQHDLRCTVPPRHHIFGQQGTFRRIPHLLTVQNTTCQTKVAHLQVTIRVDQQVRRLQVAMQHIRRVDVLQRPQHLVDEVLDVIQTQALLGVDYPVQVRLHQFAHDVNVVEIIDVPHHGGHHVDDADDVLVLEMLEEFNLAEDALGVDLVLECLGYHLDCHVGVQVRVVGRDDDAVCTRSDDTREGVLGIDGEGVIARLEGMCAVGGGALEAIERTLARY